MGEKIFVAIVRENREKKQEKYSRKVYTDEEVFLFVINTQKNVFYGLLLCLIFLSFGMLSVHAQPKCEQWNSTNFPTNMPPNLFGFSYNPFNKKTIIKGDCDAGVIALTIGDGEETTYVYDQVWIYSNGKWEEGANLRPSGKRMGRWLIGSGHRRIAEDNLTEVEMKKGVYVAAFICFWKKDIREWKCGCDSDECDQPRWNLQKFVLTP